ncbi:MAG: hypothetical protein HY679_08765 [Chloroflexi bacterium]|nr:hypothetical protein [Chloroflexota bacterium]MBI4316014.1 hypothetical protein [Chloroflexota bacterium]
MNSLPLPPSNTGLGLHYFPDDTHYRLADAELWLPRLKLLGASWLTLVGSLDRAIPEPFIRRVIDAGLEPVIHLPVRPIAPVDADALAVLYRCYAKWGVHYVVLFDRPNTRAVWPAADWGREGLVGRYLDVALPALQLAQSLGMAPVLAPLHPGGDYWDTSFLDAAIRLLDSRGQRALLDDLVLAIYGLAGNRPADWGAGGPSRWPGAKPYVTAPGSQDQIGFRAFEWYADVISARLGGPRPMIMVAGGAVPGDATDPNFPVVDATRHVYCNLALAKGMVERTLPSYLLNVTFWLLAAEGGAAPAAWFQRDGSQLPAVAAIRQLIASSNGKAAKTATGAAGREPPHPKGGFQPGVGARPLYHYLLLPPAREPSDWYALYGAALEYLRRFQPTCGFSVLEAQSADFVTIVGDEAGITAASEQALLAAGCKVERVGGRDVIETQMRLNELAQTGQRFSSI